MKAIILICSLFIVDSLAFGDFQLPGVPGKCPNIQQVGSFNPKKMVGKWHSIYESGAPKRCLTYEFEAITDTHFHGFLYHINATIFIDQKNPENIDEGYTVRSKFQQQFDKSSILSFVTDYENYAGVYRCKEVGDVHYPYFAFWSRSYTLNEDNLEILREGVRKYEGIDVTQFKTVDQSDCPY